MSPTICGNDICRSKLYGVGMSMRNIKLVVEYDGTDFSGWQRQPRDRTVAGELEAALGKLTGEKIHLIGAGRTDGGVHATGQVANFHTKSTMPADRFQFALRFMVPRDISIRESIEVSSDFHSRFDATGKIYRYKLYNGRFPQALLRRYSCYFPFRLDEEKLLTACRSYVGQHDFSSFMAQGANDHNVFKKILRFDVEREGDMIDFVIEGDNFLRNMVRIMVGTAVYIAAGRIAPDRIERMFEGRKRHLGGPTFGAEGLYLEKVLYSVKDGE